MEPVQTTLEISRFIGLPARRCGDCGGCEFYISANVSAPACVTCNPATKGPTTPLYAILDGTRLRYHPEPHKAVTRQSVRRANETDMDVNPHLGRASYFTETERGREFERRLYAGEVFPIPTKPKPESKK